MIYVLLGMHKSGTTLFSRILHESSINMGVFDESKGYDQGNKFERLETHDLNIEILGCDYKAHSLSIHRVIGENQEINPDTKEKLKKFTEAADAQHKIWGFKDPRTCLTYNIWKKILPQHKIVAIYRHPSELWSHYNNQPRAWKIFKRLSLGLKSLHAWYVYNAEILKILKTTQVPVFFTEYKDMMSGDAIINGLSAFTDKTLKDSRNNKLYRSKETSKFLFNLILKLHRIFYPQDGDIMKLYEELGKYKTHGADQPQSTRRNKRPIFIVAFAYGGSNILLNLLRSHPGVCSPRGELNEVFKGKLDEPILTRIAKTLRYLPCMLAEGGDIFRFNDWEDRKPFKSFTQNQVDRILYDEKIWATGEDQNLYKSENVKYTREEIAGSRLLSKNLDGLIFASRQLAAMYPDAVFIALVRNGFAVSEGHLRRGYHFETFVRNYEKGCQRMLEDSKLIPNYHIVRYEDILERPQEMLREIYRMANLNLTEVEKIRQQIKKVITKDGSHQNVDNKKWKEVVWYGVDEFHMHFRPESNKNQINRLSEEQKNLIVQLSGSSLRQFGYLPDKAAKERS